MKKQSGFTLIELLLVLAIIGIISAIALPALLGQRARARDKSAVQGTISRIGDLVGQFDKAKEAISNGETTSVKAQIDAYLNTAIAPKDLNPWATASTDLIFNKSLQTMGGNATKSAFDAALVTAGSTLQVGYGQGYMQVPTASVPGFMGIVVRLDAKDSASKNLIQTKSVGIE